MPNALGVGAVLMVAGASLLLAAVRGDSLRFGDGSLPLYCLGLLYVGVLTWSESTGRRTGVLPSWTSPPTLIAGWTLAWIYLPAVSAFFDDDLLGDFFLAQGGEALLVSGLLLACVSLTILSCSYHATRLALGRRAGRVGATEPPVALRRVVGLYLVSAAVRALRLQVLGIAFGADLAAWGPLRSVDQWIGYVEDLRYLALTLLVAHVIRRGTGRLWLLLPIVVELIFGATSGFIKPFIWPVVMCVATAAVFDRLRARHLLLVAATALVASTFVPVVAAIREDRMGTIGTIAPSGVGSALATPTSYWLSGVSAGDGAYDKFFGRQAEVASATGIVMALTPAVVPYEGLARFLRLPTSLIPRVFWPDKPTQSRGVWFSTTFLGLDDDTTSSSAMTLFSEGYLFFGWTGTVLAMLITGAVLAVVRRSFDTPRLVLVYLALVPTILEIEPELSSYLTTLVQRSLVFVAVFVLLTQTRNTGVGHQRIRA
jgi:hypothetical protein